MNSPQPNQIQNTLPLVFASVDDLDVDRRDKATSPTPVVKPNLDSPSVRNFFCFGIFIFII